MLIPEPHMSRFAVSRSRSADLRHETTVVKATSHKAAIIIFLQFTGNAVSESSIDDIIRLSQDLFLFNGDIFIVVEQRGSCV